ncbi:hypothetical protein EV702DRAFT_1050213 [Suillus placidus]|uniref:Uncharacterized protein n=1 Tax=Suillus placidus TaxID=48579 RepID=A0A9P6ZIV1_9AGAM|nr:hypothetical protein EV702DRAFT_1050213 [Suillus placidus]
MPDLLRSILSRFSRLQTGNITTEQLHDEFFAYCSPNDSELRSNHRVVLNYSYDWWKDHFDTLGFVLPFLDVDEVLEMTQDHFEQLPMGAMLVPSPAVTGQVEGDALLNQILAVRAHIQHLGKTLASMLEEKTQKAAAAASTMSQLEGPMDELEDALLNSSHCFTLNVMYNTGVLFDCNVAGNQQSILPPLTLDVPTMLACQQLARVLADAYSNPIQLDLDMIWYNEALDKCSNGRIAKHEEALLQKLPHGSERLLEKPSAEMEEATVGMGSLLKKSMTVGAETK